MQRLVEEHPAVAIGFLGAFTGKLRVGTTREMIGRALKTLEKERAIRLDRHRVIIVSRAALVRMLRDRPPAETWTARTS